MNVTFLAKPYKRTYFCPNFMEKIPAGLPKSARARRMACVGSPHASCGHRHRFHGSQHSSPSNPLTLSTPRSTSLAHLPSLSPPLVCPSLFPMKEDQIPFLLPRAIRLSIFCNVSCKATTARAARSAPPLQTEVPRCLDK